MTAPDLFLDHFLPHPQFELARTEIVDAPVEETYSAAREFDFTDVHGGVVSAAGWLRLLPERRHNRRHGPPRRPTRLTRTTSTPVRSGPCSAIARAASSRSASRASSGSR